MFVDIRAVLFLIASVMGYLLLFLARREENWPRLAGLIIGFAIIIVSAVSILSNPRMYTRVYCPIIKAESHNEIIYRLFTAISDGLFFIAFFMGYLVLFLARREENRRRLAGHVVGLSVMLVSTAYILLNPMMYSWIRHPIQAQPDKEGVAQRMKLYKGVGPWLPEEIPH